MAEPKNTIAMEMTELLRESFPCSDPNCELDASVFITEGGERGGIYAWAKNPWVWALGFKRVEASE